MRRGQVCVARTGKESIREGRHVREHVVEERDGLDRRQRRKVRRVNGRAWVVRVGPKVGDRRDLLKGRPEIHMRLRVANVEILGVVNLPEQTPPERAHVSHVQNDALGQLALERGGQVDRVRRAQVRVHGETQVGSVRRRRKRKCHRSGHREKWCERWKSLTAT